MSAVVHIAVSPLLTPMFSSPFRRFLAAAACLALLVSGLLGITRPAFAQTVGIAFPDYIPSPEPELIIGPPGEQFTFTRTGKNTGNAYTMAEAMVLSLIHI